MATDYDAPRTRPETEEPDENLEAIRASTNERRSNPVIEDEANLHQDLELPGADLSGENLDDITLRIVPQQDNEFTCASCFLVQHISRAARGSGRKRICRDCA